jgi:ribose 5-phosphate isomerase A
VITDNQNLILDVHGMAVNDALEMEARINQITGVVCNGLFAARPADILLLGAPSGVEIVLSPSQ